ncbi:host-nuclease inhibitor Gam family protein [Avibacterium paragallinarum]|uniref:Host-nuclease inhibitor protein Gam n=1 Tax=Avibacterium paragallinarum TaxID=728 RepID=A0A0F5EVH2_AVIPA|nr:host-nuclease inhibitor Gam family protein [Avibacterium paragallinarum]KAA6207914.1 host-nuclease inhibitor protein Gam [Avibacterium paragallinarum]KKB00578.1 host-nuclease inhibitor protein Gam [Avibacterium paragallinarum]QZP15559.1 host-nuclease inhibitor Gam family protein [Avibacterium paragallinarum]QZP15685.1 host-nuclease inhibitor Gam family protein [Avibacterium paragallinarum]RZN60788.1 host-nuclease inhibitor protein Gam [Avibacterium paragallinarum]
MSKTRLKSDTIRYQTREEVEIAIKDIGDLQRELQRLATHQNDELAAITEKYAPKITALQEQMKPLQKAIEVWCEANRAELTQNGKTKTGSFNTGEVQWRQRPPSVSIRKADEVLARLRALGLTQFIRTKEEPNKEAMLAEPNIASTVTGITIKTAVEDFVIKPFEQEV